jgi:MPBQ/MSBQ methyltransferase
MPKTLTDSERLARQAESAVQVAAKFPATSWESYEDWLRANYDVHMPKDGRPIFMNHGYWFMKTASFQEASENLLDKLTADLPSTGTILDVACGYGATTQYLCRRWNPKNVHAINMTQVQIDFCKRLLPDCSFRLMDAANMQFAPETFDSILCVEAAFHFNTRRDFFSGAYRSLKPGGMLALSDELWGRDTHKGRSWVPEANHIESYAQYRQQVLDAGFKECEVIDITNEGLRSYYSFRFSKLADKWIWGEIDFEEFQARSERMYVKVPIITHNLVCFARK